MLPAFVPTKTMRPSSGDRTRWIRTGVLYVLVATPVIYMLARGLLAGRNVALADDIDGVLMLLMRLREGGSWSDLWSRLFELSNEHRMVTSRVMVVISYWLTGTVNFAIFGVLGNLFICGACAVLVASAGGVERRWAMALVLAALLFQLEHFENFFWSGSSIDHFQVVLLATSAVVLLARGGSTAVAGAIMFAALATLTLAHGMVVWPVGALMLIIERRWKQLMAWLAVAAAAAWEFLGNFQFNPEHHIGDFSAAGLARIARYWLELLGAPVALGFRPAALVLGVALLAWMGWQVGRGAWRRERIALPLACWAIGALALVAVGRANLGGGVLGSRYHAPAALAWAMVVFVELQLRREGARPYRWLVWAVPGLAVFNLAADVRFAPVARAWTVNRDEAVAAYMRHGRDGMEPARLHPRPVDATRILRQAEEVGVFEMPRQAQERALANARESSRIAGAIDRIDVDNDMVRIDGWAAMAGHEAKGGELHLVLRSADAQRVLTTAVVTRPDVAAAFPGERWREAGFRFELRRWLLPPDGYQLGYLIATAQGAEIKMIEQRLELDNEAFTLEPDKVNLNRVVYDELRIHSPTATVTAVPNKFTRVSFIDELGVLVHADFSGPGRLTVAFARSALLTLPREGGGRIRYLKGHARFAIVGANATTGLVIHAARRQLPGHDTMRPQEEYGIAHIASVSIASDEGKFGALRTGNVCYLARTGVAGVHALGVQFMGPVYVGNIRAAGDATPELLVGSANDVRVTGGDLFQPNGRAVAISGIPKLRFARGTTVRGERLPARRNRAVLHEEGRDVSARVVDEMEAVADAAEQFSFWR